MDLDQQENKNNIYVVMTLARQIDGEYVFLKSEKAFRKASEADNFLKKIKKDHVDENGKIKPVNLSTEQGQAQCMCESGVFIMELE